MKRLSIILTAGVAVVVLGLVQHAPAWADQVSNTTIPISGTTANPCNGENVTYSGQAHILISLTMNGNTAHVVEHVNEQVTGTGDQGNQYVINGTQSISQNVQIDPTTLSGEVTELIDQEALSQGSAPNFVLQELLHLTLNANGTATANFTNISAECRG